MSIRRPLSGGDGADERSLTGGCANRFEKAVYVLHAFQKKSPGIRMAQKVVELVGERLKTAAKDYEEHYGKPKR